MPLTYVTGISTSGKSAVLEELRARGFQALGIDEDGYGRWIHRESGRVRESPPLQSDVDAHQWYRDHNWVLDIDKIARLKRRLSGRNGKVFLCGVAVGDADAWPHFEVVCALMVDEATIMQRVGERSNHWFGKGPGELDRILEWNAGYEETYRGFGAVIIDATRPLTEVLDAVLSAAGE